MNSTPVSSPTVPDSPPLTRLNSVISILVLLFGVALLTWVVVRNEPFKDEVSPQVIRVLLALTAGWGVYSLPGQFVLSYASQGQNVKASSAIGVFALVYLGTPTVIPNLKESNVRQTPPESFSVKSWSASEYLSFMGEQPKTFQRRNDWLYELIRFLQGTYMDRVLVCESSPFQAPYDGFNLLVYTVPEGRKSHKVIGILARKDGTTKTFSPLVHIRAQEGGVKRIVMAVPPSKKGDYLLIVLGLNPKDDTTYPQGRSFPIGLYRL